jgi:predicted transcriptional regulator of viral defense system
VTSFYTYPDHTLLQDHPEGLTPAEMRDLLGVERSLADTVLGMARYGLVQRVGRGRYRATEAHSPEARS